MADLILPVDHDERRRAAEDLSQCFCVEASAGTGKTTLLTDRFINLVKSGAAVERIVAITFTEMAAAELKVRIRDELEEQLAQTEDPLLAERLEIALRQMETAQISTIHSFASRLLRERPVEAGVDPFFETMDQVQSELFFRKIWTAWLESHLQAEDSAFRRPLLLGATLGAIEQLARGYYKNRDLKPAAPTCDPVEPAAALEELTALIGRLEALADSCCMDAEDKGCLSIRDIAGRASALQETDPEKRLLELLNALPKKIPTHLGAKPKWQPGKCDEQKQLCGQLRELRDSVAENIGAWALHGLFRELEDFLTAMHEAKRARGVLDFQDLLILARDALRDDLSVRAYFQHQYDHLLVDEFQDTDPLQAEIIFFLAEDRPRASLWSEVELRPGKLFIVGDPKQSIYRFRRADIEVYEQAKTIVGAQGAYATIYQNWRSQIPVIEWVNAVCGCMIQPSAAGVYQPAYVPLAPSTGEKAASPGTFLLTPPEGAALGKAGEARAAEAECIAAAIRCMLDEGWQVRERDVGSLRAVRPGDIALLFPGTTEIETFEEALQARGIGYQFEGGRRFHLRREVHDLAVVLGALDNPENELMMAGALQTLFFRIPLGDLAAFKREGGRFNYLRPAAEPSGLLGEAYELMRRLHERRHSVSLAALIEDLLEETQSREFVMYLPRGEQAVMNLDKIISLARYLEGSTQLTLRGLVRWLRDMEDEKAEEPETVSDESEGAVHILTVHKAKGLEFPVVVLANLASGSSGYDKQVADRLGGRFFAKLSSEDDFPLQSESWEEAKAEEALRRQAERQRLFYVATTRARDYLLVPLFPGERSAGYVKELLEMRAQMAPLREAGHLGELNARDLAERLAAAAGGAGAIAAAGGDEGSAGPEAENVMSREECLARLARLKRTPAGRYRRETPSAEKEEPLGITAFSAGAGFKLGSALHALMERVALDGTDDARRSAALLARASGIEEQAGRLAELAHQCLGSPVIKRAAKAPRALREVPFTLLEGERLVEGRIDLLFEEEGSLVLVDYKADAVSPGELPERVERYRQQGRLYAEAAGKICGRPVKEVVFLFAAIPEEVSLQGAELI